VTRAARERSEKATNPAASVW